MSFKDSSFDFFFKYLKVLQAIAAFLLLTAISFQFNSHEIWWSWSGLPLIACLLVIAGLVIGIVVIVIKDRQLAELSRKVKELSFSEDRSNLLTRRQKEVFELILSGKSNKEITQLLHIEFSTLKSHINKIYKTLGVSNRREVIRNFRKSDV